MVHALERLEGMPLSEVGQSGIDIVWNDNEAKGAVERRSQAQECALGKKLRALDGMRLMMAKLQ